MNVKEFRKTLRNLKPYVETFVIGNDKIKNCEGDYAVGSIYDEDNIMTDYSSFTYGFKMKWLVNRYLALGLITEK